MIPNRFVSSIACAKAAARAVEAIRLWAGRMTPEDRQEVLRRLQTRQEWLAAELWEKEIR